MIEINKAEFIKDLEIMSLSKISKKYGISIGLAQYYRNKFGIKRITTTGSKIKFI